MLKSVSYIFHPLLMPLIGLVFYFSKSPRFIPKEIMYAKVISVFILTVVLPLLLFSLLKNLKLVKSLHLGTTKERLLPLLLNGVILSLVINRVLPTEEFIELHYFFVGILISNLLCLILALLKFKASIHLIGVAGVFAFFVALSLHFNININGSLALMSIITGAVATSRLHLKAHNYTELLIGFCVGAIPQWLVFYLYNI